jgi:uncharacterized GH25 family protein
MRLVPAAALAGGLLISGATVLSAHDLFIKLTSSFIRPGAAVRAPVLNGTFSSSTNAVARARIADVSLVTPDGRKTLDTTVVDAGGDTTFLALRTGAAGTYVVGLSVRPNSIDLSGKDFTGYLEEEALTGVIAARRQTGTSADSVTERYSKHVKAVFQVGDRRTDGFQTVFGYPAELIPLDNPYSLEAGGTLRVRCLVNGQPTAGLAVLAGGRRPDGSRLKRLEVASNAEGIAAVPLSSRGHWYVKFIHMAKVDDGDVDYESTWATLTFEVR